MEEDEEDEDEVWEVFNGGWIEMFEILWMEVTYLFDFGLVYRFSFLEDGESSMFYLDFIWLFSFSVFRVFYYFLVFFVIRFVVVFVTRFILFFVY